MDMVSLTILAVQTLHAQGQPLADISEASIRTEIGNILNEQYEAERHICLGCQHEGHAHDLRFNCPTCGH